MYNLQIGYKYLYRITFFFHDTEIKILNLIQTYLKKFEMANL